MVWFVWASLLVPSVQTPFLYRHFRLSLKVDVIFWNGFRIHFDYLTLNMLAFILLILDSILGGGHKLRRLQ
jgi:hypothetical protein